MPADQSHIEQLIAQRLTGDISVEGDALLDTLIQADAGVNNLWQDTARAYQLYDAGVFAAQVNEVAAWKHIQEEISPETTKLVGIATRNRQKRRWLAVAASVIVLAGAGMLAWKQWLHPGASVHAVANPPVLLKLANGKTIELKAGQQQLQAKDGASSRLYLQDGSVVADAAADKIGNNELNTLAIPEGKDYYLRLSDGTEVWLNAASELQFPLSFSGSQRLVKLKGEAYFKVAGDAARPFVVHNAAMNVQVLGTEFNFKCYPEEAVTASLVSGQVVVSNTSGEQVQLRPGQAVQEGGDHLNVSSFDEAVTLAWMKGIYLFNDKPLDYIRHTIERWYGVKVEMNAAVADKRFTGAMEKNKSLDLFLKNIEITSNIRSKRSYNTISLY